METPPLGRNILQRVGTPANTKQERKSRSESPSPERNMNMKQENPTFLVPPLWKDSLSLENIANDFLDSNVTGEVMKLDDFLKELQSSDVQNEEEERASTRTRNVIDKILGPFHGTIFEDMDDLCGVPGGQGMLQQPQMHDVRNQQDPHNRLYNLIRPANIDSLRESNSDHNQHQQLQGPHGHGQQQLPQHHQSSRQLHQQQQQDLHGGGGSGGPVRPPIMHHVGKPPELYNNHNLQASVRPLVRQNMVSPENHMLQNDRLDRLDRLSPESKKSLASKRKERMRTTSEDSEDDSRSFSGYTSTVCVNFSQDDLRLATIPGQVQDFDPATRRFSEEELKPQPIIRKRKKQFVPEELKNNKYWAKRSKNNEAAKRSREARRLKENQIAMRARFLEEENLSLKNEVENLKKENGDLKQMMVALEEKLNQLVDKR